MPIIGKILSLEVHNKDEPRAFSALDFFRSLLAASQEAASFLDRSSDIPSPLAGDKFRGGSGTARSASALDSSAPLPSFCGRDNVEGLSGVWFEEGVVIVRNEASFSEDWFGGKGVTASDIDRGWMFWTSGSDDKSRDLERSRGVFLLNRWKNPDMGILGLEVQRCPEYNIHA